MSTPENNRSLKARRRLRETLRDWAGGTLFVLLLAGCVSNSRPTVADDGGALSPGRHEVSIRSGGLERTYTIHVPAKLSKPAPIVIMYHGGGGWGDQFLNDTRWDRIAEREGLLAVFPDGIRPKPNRRPHMLFNAQSWNDGSGRYPAGERNIDDVGFTRDIITDLSRRFSVDRKRIYAGGFSNGSSMAFRVGAELGDLIAAIAPVASSGLRTRWPSRIEIPLIYIHGADDDRNPIRGGDVKKRGKLDRRLSAREIVKRWAKANGCDDNTEESVDAGSGVRGIRYRRGCKRGADVEFYTVESHGHVWPGGEQKAPKWLLGKSSRSLKATILIWEFFKRHPKS